MLRVILSCLLLTLPCHAKASWLKQETVSSFVDLDKLQKKLASTPPQWMLEQLKEDFAPYQTRGIHVRQLDATWATVLAKCPGYYNVRYRIIDNELYRYFSFGEPISLTDNTTEKGLKTLLYLKRIEDSDFILSYLDGPTLPYIPEHFFCTDDPSLQAPVLFSATVKNTPHVILIPDWRSLGKWWANNIQEVKIASKKVPWESKQNTVLWRGSYSSKPARLNLCYLSKQTPELIDAKINTPTPENPAIDQEIIDNDLKGGFVSWKEFMRAKYALTLDGNCTASPSLQWRLLSSCVTLKQESHEIQWFYSTLKPYIHYIPIQNDLSDLYDKISWATTHDQQCHTIAKSATTFIENNLMPEDVYLYLYLVLKEYQAHLHAPHLKQETLADPRWINIHHRRHLKKHPAATYTSEPTPFNH